MSDEPLPDAPPPLPRPELHAIFSSPTRALDLVLARKERLVSTIADGESAGLLAAVLLFVSVLFALPFGAVIDVRRVWVVPTLYLGSLAICFPSLQVFSAYLGLRVAHKQYLSLALVVTAVAALFTFGFFPIQWFLATTMLDDSDLIGPAQVSVALLGLSLGFGVAHLLRCLRVSRRLDLLRSDLGLIVAWQGLLLFIAWRMALALELV